MYRNLNNYANCDYIFKLETIVYDKRARGEWCKSKYPGHPKGCPNYPKCITSRPDFKEIVDYFDWYAVIEKFDLKSHAEKMKTKHPEWSERQCRNPLYWQGTVRKNLKKKAISVIGQNFIIDIPEACGVEVFRTMAGVGVILERNNPQTIIKVMLVGKYKNERRYW